MPIVFVHGVNNRAGPEYDQSVSQRREFLRKIVVSQMGLEAGSVKFFDPFWGDEGVKFRWENASLPTPDKEYETFGSTHDEAELVLAARLPELALYGKGNIVAIAKKSLPEAVDVLWAAAMSSAKTQLVHAALAETYILVADYAERETSPTWLSQAAPSNFVDQLIEQAKKSLVASGTVDSDKPTYETFGISEFLEELGEAAKRIGNVLGDISGDIVTALGRRRVHVTASFFIGDVFQYLTRRGDGNQPGAIPQIVISAIREAHEARSMTDPKLVVIGHSLGGVISYDALTSFLTDIKVDAFVSVGSQVAIFEEMTLYKASRLGIPLHPPKDRLQKPGNIALWLNIFDTTDVFGFRAEGVFEGVQDFVYDTGYGLFNAHGGYFERPSFYRRLAAHLKEMSA